MSEPVLADRHVHPATIAASFLIAAPRAVIGIPAILAVTSEIGWGYLLLLAFAAVVLTALGEWLGWRSFRYGVGERELVIESGILSRNRRSIPFERVQDVNIERGPLARLFGLAKVKIETGGGGADEGVLDSITLEEADRIRRAIRIGRAAEPAAGAAPGTEPEPDSRLLFSLSPKRLLLLGLFKFSLIYLAVLFGILNTVEPWIPFDIHDPGRWLGLIGEERVRNLTPGGAAAVLLVALFLGVVTGLVTTVAREFGFRLLAEGKRFRRKRGLFTRSEVVLPKGRIQLALVRTGPVREALGYAELKFQNVGAGEEEGGQQSAAPLARREELATILAEAGSFRLPEPGDLQRVPRRHVVRAVIRASAVPLTAILGASFLAPPVLALTALLPIPAAAAILSRRHGGYRLAGDTLFAAGGIWRRRLWLVPLRNIQSLSLTRTPLQRRLGLATLATDTAGAPALGGVRIVDMDERAARELAATIASRLRADAGATAAEAGTSEHRPASEDGVLTHRAPGADRKGGEILR